MGTQNIRIYDKEKLLSFSYNDLLSAHGGEMPGGVALVYKLMQWIFNDVVKEIPLRGTCSFYSGLGKNGKGIIDGADHVMQIKNDGKLFLDLSSHITEDDTTHLQTLRNSLADAILSSNAEDLFQAERI